MTDQALVMALPGGIDANLFNDEKEGAHLCRITASTPDRPSIPLKRFYLQSGSGHRALNYRVAFSANA